MAEYRQQQRATLERTARLRAERLAREANGFAGKAKSIVNKSIVKAAAKSTSRSTAKSSAESSAKSAAKATA